MMHATCGTGQQGVLKAVTRGPLRAGDGDGAARSLGTPSLATMSGPAESIWMAKVMPNQMILMTIRVEKRAEMELQGGIYVDQAMGDWRGRGDGARGHS